MHITYLKKVEKEKHNEYENNDQQRRSSRLAESLSSQWFSEIRKWSQINVDKERVTWIRCFGIPCHAWNYSFFKFLEKMVGSLVSTDDNTMKMECMDVFELGARWP